MGKLILSLPPPRFEYLTIFLAVPNTALGKRVHTTAIILTVDAQAGLQPRFLDGRCGPDFFSFDAALGFDLIAVIHGVSGIPVGAIRSRGAGRAEIVELLDGLDLEYFRLFPGFRFLNLLIDDFFSDICL